MFRNIKGIILLPIVSVLGCYDLFVLPLAFVRRLDSIALSTTTPTSPCGGRLAVTLDTLWR